MVLQRVALRLVGVADLRVGSGLPALESCEPVRDVGVKYEVLGG